MHRRSGMTIDHRVPATPGRSSTLVSIDQAGVGAGFCLVWYANACEDLMGSFMCCTG